MPIHFASPWLLFALPIGMAYIAWAGQVSYVNLKPGRRRLVLWLRMAVVALLVVALSRPSLQSRSRQVPTVILVDVSDSVPEVTLEKARTFVKGVWAARQDHSVKVVSFGARALEVPVEAAGPKITRHDGQGSDLGQAITFARAFAPGGGARIILLTDGNETAHDPLFALEAARADGIELTYVRLATTAPVDARLAMLELPETLRRQEPTQASVVIEATQAGSATVLLEENGFRKEERTVKLTAGKQRIDFKDFAPAVSGLVRYSAQVTMRGDTTPGNDRYLTQAQVSGPPRVLLASATPEEGAHLEEALAAQEITVEAMSPGALPSTIDGFISYDEVILVGIAPSDLDCLRQNALASYVRDSGGGLLFVSGPRGLRRDPDGKPSTLANVLPLELAASSEKQEPPVAIILVIDQSGSMTGDKLGFAKQAARAVVDRLTPRDQVGVIAFDANFSWLVPFQSVDDKEAIKSTIEKIGAGGGTRFYPALEEAYFTLGSSEAAVRHAILLTDGVSTDPDIFPQLMAKARQKSITVSTVAIGQEADVKLLSQIAKLGGGRYTQAARAEEVPKIFVKETETIQKDATQHSDTLAQPATTAREILGIDWKSAPPLHGYVRTKTKGGVETLLSTPRGDPLLVRWRYGLGQVLAFTSDATAAWASSWLPWSGFGKLWTQLVRGAQRPHGRQDLQLRIAERGQRATLSVEAIDAEGRFIDDLEVRVRVINGSEESSESRDFPLQQIGPGHYTAEIALAPGKVLARPLAQRGGRSLDGDWVVLARPYPHELDRIGENAGFFAALVRLGAIELRPDAPAEALGPAKESQPRERSIMLPLVLLVLSFFLLDLVAKRARWEMRG